MRIAPLLLTLFAAPAAAFTLDGAIIAATVPGEFVKLDPAEGFAVGADTFDTPNLYAFDEDQNIVLEADLLVVIGAHGRVIPKGSVIASHYIFFDPAWGTRQAGYVEFDSVVLGVAASQHTLRASDFLANTDVTYLNPILRGLEWEDYVRIDPDNPFRVQMNWAASSPGDYIRVFTAKSPSV